jgi:protein-tyrosine phosphatase
MSHYLYWIESPWRGRVAIMSRPRGGDWLEEDIQEWRAAGIDTVVSLLTHEEVLDLDLTQEAVLCQKHGIELLLFPITDRSVPSSRKLAVQMLSHLHMLLTQGKNLAIHCRQGVGRAPLVAASLLVLSGISPEVAFQRVSAARGCPVPETEEQRQWVVALPQGPTPSPLKQNPAA